MSEGDTKVGECVIEDNSPEKEDVVKAGQSEVAGAEAGAEAAPVENGTKNKIKNRKKGGKKEQTTEAKLPDSYLQPSGATGGGYKWETLKMMMNPRVFATPVLHNDELYIIGGCDEKGEPLDSCEHYNAAKRKWNSLSCMPTKRAAPACGVVKDKIIAIGGVGTSQGPVNAVEVYCIASKKWTSMEPLVEPLLGLSLVIKDELVYVVGGMSDDTNPRGSLLSYDVERNVWKNYAQMNVPRYATFSFIVNGKLYVIGGRQGKIPNASFECYDFELNKWTKLDDIPSKRVFAMYTAADKYIFSIAGLMQPANLGFSSTMEIYDTEKGKWEIADDMKIKRGDFAVGAVGNRVICAGGLGNNGKPLTSVEAFDWGSRKWSEITDMPSAHCSCAHIMLNGRLHVVGGLTLGGAGKKVEALGYR
ncbi:kelch domain-containing protein 8B-like [Pecten maximus]|uniref:kelch domain-containing protein 8B-like n=1 Tax=Pecten maximus TaxID=6579 RepID=UPI00145885E9|nr:kelch domain-containing protein 8B-like [Pecten maximus]XP_033746812.1 kelch domain-containing protein 8B-like [Pecten maximus]XP_033746813.1 kelch domain-containing protein 8B-like [Pecten maximus]XP_033746814.1 kelch domain-containing protein 8B-like [Pecten maximus]XP_033746815.1 kelch domain-containing protein 8B-like [Pecten maximus]XP_033746816.1 kelch domain-containing protein 8B-like [Pecten maximus]XP_033746817.1 kelch domain-containing protein 8B-like [Pecten maximus]XP_03374681